MKKTAIRLEEIKLAGMKFRTSFDVESVMATSKIAPFVTDYFQQQISEKIADRKNPGVIYCCYTEYESDYRGAYTFFIGEEVNSLTQVPPDLATLIIPSQDYIKFTTDAGSMPDVVIQAWQEIWQMSPQELGGIRPYHTDFEVYDQRAANPQKTVLDIFVGIKSK